MKQSKAVIQRACSVIQHAGVVTQQTRVVIQHAGVIKQKANYFPAEKKVTILPAKPDLL
jgi:hypothetical protein